MQAEKLDVLIDRFSKKEELVIDIIGNCNTEGTIELVLPKTVKFNPSVSHKVALMSFSATAFFPNLTEISNKFYYTSSVARVLTLPTGCYDVKDYNESVKKLMRAQRDNADNITITLNAATGKTEIELKGGYKVYFIGDKYVNTWKDCLGFNENLESDGLHTAANITEVVPSQTIYIGCNICKGSLSSRDSKIKSNTLFTFYNDKRFGAPFTLTPNPTRPRELLLKEFDTIRLYFSDEDGRPIDFMGSQITGELYIYQN